MRLSGHRLFTIGLVAGAIAASAVPAVAGATPGFSTAQEGSSAAEVSPAKAPDGAAAPLSSSGVFGDPDHASSPTEEEALRKINKLAHAAGALGLYRNGPTSIVMRMPTEAGSADVPSEMDGFTIGTASSRFTKKSLDATLAEIAEVARAHPQAGTEFGYGYVPADDLVLVQGRLAASAVAAMREIDGVSVALTDNVGSQSRGTDVTPPWGGAAISDGAGEFRSAHSEPW